MPTVDAVDVAKPPAFGLASNILLESSCWRYFSVASSAQKVKSDGHVPVSVDELAVK
jgi:hypothetical protein